MKNYAKIMNQQAPSGVSLETLGLQNKFNAIGWR